MRIVLNKGWNANIHHPFLVVSDTGEFIKGFWTRKEAEHFIAARDTMGRI